MKNLTHEFIHNNKLPSFADFNVISLVNSLLQFIRCLPFHQFINQLRNHKLGSEEEQLHTRNIYNRKQFVRGFFLRYLRSNAHERTEVVDPSLYDRGRHVFEFPCYYQVSELWASILAKHSAFLTNLNK